MESEVRCVMFGNNNDKDDVDDDDDDDDNNNNNNNNNTDDEDEDDDDDDDRTERRKSRFLQSLHCAAHCPCPLWPGRNHVQIMCKSCANHVQHVESLPYISCATCYEETVQLLNLTEFESHLFWLYFIG